MASDVGTGAEAIKQILGGKRIRVMEYTIIINSDQYIRYIS
jgi:hypothetical protein